MNKPSRPILAITILAAIAASSCVNQSTYDDKSISFTELKQSKSFQLENTAEDYGIDRDLIYFDSVSILVPTLIGNHDVRPLQDSIFKMALDTTGIEHQALLDKYFEKTISDIGFTAKEIDSDTVNISIADGFEIINGAVINLNSQLLVYCITNESYAPHAAHGMTVKKYVNYRNDTGKILTLNDIFSPSGIKELPSLISSRANDLSAIFGPTEVSALPAGNNFYISPAGEIVFAYQPYEIASFAQGFINVPFYPYELIDHMTAEGLELFNLQDLNN